MTPPTSYQPVRTLRAHLDAIGLAPSAAPTTSVTIEPLDSWALPSATSLAPTTICWTGGGEAAAITNPVAPAQLAA